MVYRLKRGFLFTCLAGFILIPAALYADERTTTITLDSDILGERRDILVSLPDSYNETDEDYTLLVTTDAELIHEFAFGTSLYLSRQGDAPEMIVVGIVNTNREKDLYYEVDSFTSFLENELIPFIDSRYRTNKLRALFGFSSGTVPVDKLLFSNSDLFSLYIAAGWGMSDAGYTRLIDSIPDIEFTGQRVYLSTEGNTIRRRNVEKILGDLDRIKPGNLNWTGRIYENLDHGDVMTRGLYDGLEFLFNDWPIPEDLAAKGMDGLKEHEHSLRQSFAAPVELQSETLAGAAFDLFHADEDQHASAVTSLLAEAVRRKPWGAEMLAYLAYAQWQFHDYDDARNNIHKAIDLAKASSDPRLVEYEDWLSEWQKLE